MLSSAPTFFSAAGCNVDRTGLVAQATEGVATTGVQARDAQPDEGDAGPLDEGVRSTAEEAHADDATAVVSDADDDQASGLEPDAISEVGVMESGGQPADGADAPAEGEPDLQRGLLLRLPLDDPPGAGTARDLSGRGHRVTLQDRDPAQAWVEGFVGGAVDLGGPVGGGHLRVESSSSLNRIGYEFSFAAWVWRTSGQPGVIVSRRASAAAATLYRLSIEEDHRLRLLLNDRPGVRLSLSSTIPLSTGRWVHVAVTRDRAAVRLYIAGQPSGSASYGVPLAPDVSPLLIGAAQSADGLIGLLPERLDEVLLYDRALSGAEVSALASVGGAPSPIVQSTEVR